METKIEIIINKKSNQVVLNTIEGDKKVDTRKIHLSNENNFPVGRGARGIYVQNIQTFLNLKDYGIDGVYGNET